MQNNDKPDNRGRFELAKYRWPALLTVLVVAAAYMICKPPDQHPITKDLVYEPVGGAWVNDSLGNGDGQLNPGEQVRVFPRLTNNGKQPIPAFDLVLSTPEKAVNLKDNRCHYPAIEPGQTVISEDPFEFKLDTLFFADCVLFLGKAVRPVRQAGFVGDAFAGITEEIAIILAATSNYRVCLASAELNEIGQAPGSQNWNYVLTIDLRLCNTSSASLHNPFLKIDPTTIGICDLPGVQFTTQAIGTMTAGVNQLFYTQDLPTNTCLFPNSPTFADGKARFRFNITMAKLLPNIGRKCVNFSVQVYIPLTSDDGEPIEKLVARTFIGGEAKVIPPSTSPGIARLNNRRLR